MPVACTRPIVCGLMRFVILGSGSSGNAALVECGGLRLMIDAGLSAKQLTLRLAQVGVAPASLDGILLTHEHGDHVRGLKVFLKQNPLPVFATAATSRVVREAGIDGGQWKLFEAGRTFAIGEVTIDSFAIQHDAVDPVGFVIHHQAKRLGLLSDAGFVTRSMTENLRELNGLFIEANYDDDLLEADTKRPWPTKQRIRSRHGHLSNTQVTELVREIAHPALARVVLGHLSADCNVPQLALNLLRECLTTLGHHHTEIHCACPHEPTGWFAV
ncbi:MAG: MBL fold metallo-hydrolase [Verrucomicrobiota bacterium]